VVIVFEQSVFDGHNLCMSRDLEIGGGGWGSGQVCGCQPKGNSEGRYGTGIDMIGRPMLAIISPCDGRALDVGI